jgi:hypothetical protein
VIVKIEGIEYELEVYEKDPFVTSNLEVAYSETLAEHFMPILFDPRDHGSKPYPPDFVAYRLILDPGGQRMCVLYEVYWRKQDCTWKELNKDHDHDYEQIQVHFNLMTGEKERVIVSSVGPLENGGHGVEVYSHTSRAAVRTVAYTTSSKPLFPWGGNSGERNATQVIEIPIGALFFEEGRTAVVVLNCYHAFTGLKRELSLEERKELTPTLARLDRKLLYKWYYRHAQNRFGHDISKPFDEPYVMYYPPPEDWGSRLAYGFLWFFSSLKMMLGL